MENNLKEIEKIIEIVNRRHLSKMFDVPIKFSIGDVKMVYRKHYVITIELDKKYFEEEPYALKIGQWWVNLLKVSDVYRNMYPDGSLNFQPVKVYS